MSATITLVVEAQGHELYHEHVTIYDGRFLTVNLDGCAGPLLYMDKKPVAVRTGGKWRLIGKKLPAEWAKVGDRALRALGGL